MPSHWILLSFGADRQYGGNTGYADQAATSYAYTDRVANHKQLEVGDMVAVRSRAAVEGFARITRIEKETGRHLSRRCPVCRASGIKERQRSTPRWRCSAGHEFEDPLEEYEPCVQFTAHYEQPFVLPDSPIDAEEVEKAVLRRSDQLYIIRADFRRIRSLLETSAPRAAELLRRLDLGEVLTGDEGWESRDADGKSEPGYAPDRADHRPVAFQAIRLRRGQAQFRRKLLKRCRGRCVVTGCSVTDLLEAAHIMPYRGEKDNHVENGLILRSDIHTLFDCDLLGIEPEARVVRVATCVDDQAYRQFDGCELLLEKSHKLSLDALHQRWTLFSARAASTSGSQ